MFQVITPVDGSVYIERPFPQADQIQKTLEKAQAAQANWRRRSIENRADLCTKMVDAFVSRKQDIATELTWQMGRPIRYTPGEVNGFEERARYMISIAAGCLADVQVGEKEGFSRFIKREPMGVVLVLAPWNYPYLTAVNAVVPALMAGNTVILKHAPQTPLCAERLAEAFQEAGFPEGVFQYVHADHDQVADIIRSDAVDFVAFTGSVAGGHAVQKAASERFIGVGLELGGKDPAYVRADVNLNHAVENLVDGAFFNSGQSCCGIERIYVDQAIYDDFVDGFVAFTNQYVLGNPTDPEVTLGPVVRLRNADLIREHIHDAIGQGAKTLIDESRFPIAQPETPYLAPQVLVNVDHSMRVMTEETFGPVVGIMSVSSEAEAVRLMNDSEFGLTASIWTSDEEAALHIGDQIETGTVFMNRCDYLDPTLAWTGVKNSGRGCTLSSVGYEHLTHPKSYHLRLKT